MSPQAADGPIGSPGAPATPVGKRVLRRRHHAPGDPTHPHRGRRGFMAGVLLMAGSFLIYPAYPVLILWPASELARVQIALAAGAMSWGAFSVGLYLAGRRGWVWLRRRWKSRRARATPPSAPP